MTPREILDSCPKGKTVKLIHGQYYVYEQRRVKDPESGKWKTKSGKCVGKVVPGKDHRPYQRDSGIFAVNGPPQLPEFAQEER